LRPLDLDLLTDEDVKDRREAFEELEKGEALDLQEGMKKW